MPMRGDRYVIEIDGPYYIENEYDRRPIYKVIGLNNIFLDENELKCLRELEMKQDDLIRIGDEVEITTLGVRFFVTNNSLPAHVRGVNKFGETFDTSYRYLKKTGNKNPKIKDIFG